MLCAAKILFNLCVCVSQTGGVSVYAIRITWVCVNINDCDWQTNVTISASQISAHATNVN